MLLSTKPDWESCKQRYIAWWNHEDFGRAGICVVAPLSPEKGSPPEPPKEKGARWTDKEYICARMDYMLDNTFFGGEALPVWNAGYPGWDSMPVFWGCEVELDDATGWQYPIMEKGELADYDPMAIKTNKDNPWYKLSVEFRKLTLEQCAGRALPSVGACGGGGDNLAALRGNERLLFDIKDDPDAVLALGMRLMDLWIEQYEERYVFFREAAEGSTCWFDMWSPGRFYSSQCDVAYMISTEDFDKCFLPAIEKQTRYIDHTVHHVDGVGNFRHVDALLSLERLQAFQIAPGAGKPSALAYPETLFKVQRAGKNLWIHIQPEEIKTALDMLSSRGLMIYTAAGSREEAEEILRYVEKNSVVRKV